MYNEEEHPRLTYFKRYLGKQLEGIPSGVTRWLAGTFREITKEKLVAEFVVREEMTNPMKILHGGAAAMIMDDMIGIAVYLLGYEYAHTSVNLSCDFLNPAARGSTVTATATVVRKGRNIVHCECDIRDSEHKLIAKSSSNLIVTPLPLKPPM